jgi:hypothetical protein
LIRIIFGILVVKNGRRKMKKKNKKSWWESYWEGCTLLYVKDIKPECLTDKAKIKYKEELEENVEM